MSEFHKPYTNMALHRGVRRRPKNNMAIGEGRWKKQR